jgi:hypothetical protein
MSVDDIDATLAKGTVRKIDAVIHFNIGPFVDKALAENKSFLTLKKEQQLQKLETYAEQVIKSEQPKLQLNVPEQFSEGN